MMKMPLTKYENGYGFKTEVWPLNHYSQCKQNRKENSLENDSYVSVRNYLPLENVKYNVNSPMFFFSIDASETIDLLCNA